MEDTEHQELIEADPALANWDSSYDSNSSLYDTSTQSLTSSVNQYITENGRRYHTYYGPDKYLHPVDEIEKDRLDLSHELFRLILGEKLYKAPINQNPSRILDIGTGTGIWAIDMADEFREAEVLGVDLTPIQPPFVPANCRFEVDDVTKEWTYRSEHFDFIHGRNIAQGIDNWPKLMEESKRCLKKGGYIELSEIGCESFSDDGSLRDDNGYKIACEILSEAMIKIGRPFPRSGTLKKILEDGGFVDVREHRYKQPIGPWPRSKRLKVIGGMAMMTADTGIEAYCMAVFTRILGMSKEDATAAIEKARSDMKDPKAHIWTEYLVAYGRKP